MKIPFLNRNQSEIAEGTTRHLSRRCFVQTGFVASARSLVGLGAKSAGPRSVLQATLSREAALNELIEGNHRYATGSMTAHEHDLQVLQAKTAEKQEPFAAVLSCSDSRVPVELLFDQSIGHVFVCRVAGNVTTPEVIASLEYGAAVLGTRVILVLAHSNCGAVAATIKGSDVPGQISALYPRIRPAVDLAGPNIEAAAKANAKIHAKLLSEASTAIGALVKDNKIKITAGYYNVTNGTVTLL